MANEKNLIPIKKGECPLTREQQKAGGLRSAEVKKERKTIAECLRKVLDEKITTKDGIEMTRKEAITAKIIAKMFNDPDIRDLKVLSELLGEAVQKMEIKGEKSLTPSDAMKLIDKIRKNV